jgi:MATE family multidrug resistance protein
MRRAFINRWQGAGGLKEVLFLALPLVISTSAHSVQLFIDRMFLFKISPDAMNASMQSGLSSFAVIAFFIGITGYSNMFVAQYLGAQRFERIGPATWQAIYLAGVGGCVIVLLIPFAQTISIWFAHDDALAYYETIYFKWMCLAAPFMLISSAISGFYTGRGKTAIVMWVNLAAMMINIVLDYCLIFGNWGFPKLGFMGAPIATFIATAVTTIWYVIDFVRQKNRDQFFTNNYYFDVALFRRLIRFGLPAGIQFAMEIFPFALFIMFIGRIDVLALSASVIAFQLNILAFLPMIGFGIAVSTLVGQNIGRHEVAIASRATWSACYMCLGYTTVIALLFIVFPNVCLYPFINGLQEDVVEITCWATNILWFVAFYCLFDAGNIIFSGALKGAGDTRFVMIISITLNWLVLVFPVWLTWKMGWGVYTIWGFATLYVCMLAVSYLCRFVSGKWKSMRVIEADDAFA